MYRKVYKSLSTQCNELLGIGLNIYINLGKTDITILSLSTHEHKTAFSLFKSSLMSFNNILYFSTYMFYTSFFRFTPGRLMFFDAIT